MSLRKTINLLPVEFDYANNSIEAIIYYERKYYTGLATCHSDDMDFFSTKVGQTIAHKRAVINTLKNIKEKTNIEYNAVKRFYNDLLRVPLNGPGNAVLRHPVVIAQMHHYLINIMQDVLFLAHSLPLLPQPAVDKIPVTPEKTPAPPEQLRAGSGAVKRLTR